MKTEPQSKLERVLKLDYSDESSPWLLEGLMLRKLVGRLGMLLPLFLCLSLFIDSGLTRPLESISHYYYTRASGVFVIVVSMLAIFLIVYKGKSSVDFFLSFSAGFFALCLLLFPTGNITGDLSVYSVTMLRESPFREGFHYVSAAVFLGCLAYMSIFLFTKSDKAVSERSTQKKIRNRIYRTCGVMMILAIGVIAAGFLKIIPHDYYKVHCLTFWMEVVALEGFGVSWFIKGETYFRDK